MIDTILQNIPTILGAIVVFGIFFKVSHGLYKDKKNGTGGCSYKCSQCPSSGACHPK